MSTAPISPSEWKTRRSLIDPKLNALGWQVAKKNATLWDFDRLLKDHAPK